MIKSKNHVLNYFGQISKLSNKINKKKIEKLATSLANIRKKRGRVFHAKKTPNNGPKLASDGKIDFTAANA